MANAHWEMLDQTYLRRRLKEFEATLVLTSDGCSVSTLSARSNGDAQIKLRGNIKNKLHEFSPRPWAVESFLRGITIPVKHDHSHLCGNGLHGCANYNHIVIEPHKVNLERKQCQTVAQCPCCDVSFAVFPCSHNPRCLVFI